MSKRDGKLGECAVVIGGGIAGLVTARVLVDFFSRVVLLERDALTGGGTEARKGVPQGKHTHALLAAGRNGLQALFPALEDELVRDGAIRGDVVGDVMWSFGGIPKARFDSGMPGYAVTRPTLEAGIRRQVLGLAGVERMDAHDVQGLLVHAREPRVCGVRVRAQGGQELSVAADLVVDAGGRGSRVPGWLEQLGYARPREETVTARVAYATRMYRRRPDDLPAVAAITGPAPPNGLRMGALVAVEGDRWSASLVGWMGDHPPPDEAGFLEFAKSLAEPHVYEVLRKAAPLGDIAVHHFPSSVRRRYEKLTRFPGNLLVLGDALCSFNPVYGQGMSVAIVEAMALRDLLRASQPESLRTLYRPFFQRTATLIDIPWSLSATSDYAFPGVEGDRPFGTGLVNWYVGHVHRAARTDPNVCRAFFEVANLLVPPTRLFEPGIAVRLLRPGAAHRAQPVARPSPPN